MTDLPPGAARRSPSTARNREPILEVLREVLPTRGVLLEVAAGAGEHALFNAAAFPELQWTPTDLDEDALLSIGAWRDHAGSPNLQAPLRLDASAPESWPLQHADAVISINMIHISPMAATAGLLRGAGRILSAQGPLVLYGPYLEEGVVTAASNLAFDQSLKGRNPEWGLRSLAEIKGLAGAHGLVFEQRRSMPANNLMLVFRKQ